MFDAFPGNTPDDPTDFDDDAEFDRAVEVARSSDVAVVVAGEWQNMIGESASRSSLELPGRQLELIQAVVATGTPAVLLVMNGRQAWIGREFRNGLAGNAALVVVLLFFGWMAYSGVDAG